MKSIIQEASTISKAIEQAWQDSGKPQEFSIKILELPERNFIGMTVRSAKIAFIFNGIITKQAEQSSTRPAPRQTYERKGYAPRQREHVQPKREHFARPHNHDNEQTSHHVPTHHERDVYEKQNIEKQRFEKQGSEKRRYESLWSDDIIAFTRTWFGDVLKNMKNDNISFTIEPQNYYLRITLSRPVLADSDQEKHLLASLSLLLFSTVKKEFRKALRGHKVVLTHAH